MPNEPAYIRDLKTFTRGDPIPAALEAVDTEPGSTIFLNWTPLKTPCGELGVFIWST